MVVCTFKLVIYHQQFQFQRKAARLHSATHEHEGSERREEVERVEVMKY